jgi:hypothetical protein
MTIKRKKFTKGIRIKKNAEALEAEGEITIDSADDKIKAQLGGSDRAVVTEDQTQTLTNKTIDADNNPISNIETDNLKAGVLVTDVSAATSDTELPSALAVKTALEGQNEASEITYAPDGTKTIDAGSANVQTAMQDLDDESDDIRSMTGTAKNATDLGTFTGSTISDNTSTKAALQELETEVETKADGATLTTHIGDTAAHGATGAVMGTTNTQTVQNKTLDATNDAELRDNNLTITDNVDFSKKFNFDATNIPTGTTKTLGVPNDSTTLVGEDTSQTITNKTIDADNNTISNLAHGAEVDNPTSGVHGVTGDVVGTTDAQVLTGKDIDGGTASNTSRITLPKASKATLDGLTRKEGTIVYADDEDKAYIDDGTNLIEVGSGAGGSGGINYLEDDNTNAENGIGDWAAYDDGAVDVPVDGTGGSPSQISINNSPSNVLRGTRSFRITDLGNSQGEGVAVPFTIENADLAKKLTISFDYDTVNNNYVDDEYKIFVYDVTNSNIIRVNGEDLKAGAGTHYAQFQTAPDSTSYRLIFHKTTTSLLGITISFDNVSVGPTNLAFGTVVTDWEEYSATETNFTSSSSKYFWRRVGDNIEIKGAIGISSVSSTIDISFPSGITYDTAKSEGDDGDGSGLGRIGFVEGRDFGSSVSYTGSAYIRSTSSLAFIGGNADNVWTNTVPFTWASGDKISFNVRFPVAGWSSNARMSEDLGGREVAFSTEGLQAQTFSTTSFAYDILTFPTPEIDTVAAWNSSTSTYTILESGYYDISGGYARTYGATPSAGATTILGVYKNGIDFKGLDERYTDGTNTFWALGGSLVGTYLEKGDEIQLYARKAGTNASSKSGDARSNYFRIKKSASPQTMLETETVAARYVDGSGQTFTINNQQTVTWDTKKYDTHNAMDGGAGTYTVPVSGYYSIKAKATLATANITATDLFLSFITVNGTSVSSEGFEGMGTNSSTRVTLACTDDLYLEKGDVVRFDIYQGAADATEELISINTYNSFAIHRIK